MTSWLRWSWDDLRWSRCRSERDIGQTDGQTDRQTHEHRFGEGPYTIAPKGAMFFVWKILWNLGKCRNLGNTCFFQLFSNKITGIRKYLVSWNPGPEHPFTWENIGPTALLDISVYRDKPVAMVVPRIDRLTDEEASAKSDNRGNSSQSRIIMREFLKGLLPAYGMDPNKNKNWSWKNEFDLSTHILEEPPPPCWPEGENKGGGLLTIRNPHQKNLRWGGKQGGGVLLGYGLISQLRRG